MGFELCNNLVEAEVCSVKSEVVTSYKDEPLLSMLWKYSNKYVSSDATKL
jgi:hypothetical protein